MTGRMVASNRMQPMTVAERVALGRAARAAVPRSSHAAWSPAPDRVDPIVFLEQQAKTRVPELVPIRHGRMAESPFAYFRGAALSMAADLAATPRVGLQVQLCGDAHLSNFGGFASPDRALVFDINDFDETNPGPFEWDVKRLAASFEIAARSLTLGRDVRAAIVAQMAQSYRTAMLDFAARTNLDVWYARLDVEAVIATYGDQVSKRVRKEFDRTITKAKSKDRMKAAGKLARVVDGEFRIVSDPPLIVPIEELFGDVESAEVEATIVDSIRAYRSSLSPECQALLDSYRYVHLARKVVGVGSVGTQAWVALLVGRDIDDPLLLQVKEAQASVLEPYTQVSEYAQHGERVVAGQRVMQAASDIFLGYENRGTRDGPTSQFYVRQLWDWKVSADISTMDADGLSVYAQLCGWSLARAHACSGDRVAVAAYLGNGPTFDRAIADFAGAYADQNDLDHQALVQAIAQGRIPAQFGV